MAGSNFMVGVVGPYEREREREREREHYMGVDYGLKGVLGGCLVTSILMC